MAALHFSMLFIRHFLKIRSQQTFSEQFWGEITKFEGKSTSGIMSSPQRLFFVNVGLVNLLQIQLQLWPSFQPDASTLTEISLKKTFFSLLFFLSSLHRKSKIKCKKYSPPIFKLSKIRYFISIIPWKRWAFLNLFCFCSYQTDFWLENVVFMRKYFIQFCFVLQILQNSSVGEVSLCLAKYSSANLYDLVD